ncbi:MAG: hypothetical protein FP821_05785 [Sideroxydans sp.]|nr:hypothetical protein [Sideroxydans sp.]
MKKSMAAVAMLSMFVAGSAMAEESMFASLLKGGKSAGGYAGERTLMGVIDIGDTTTTGTVFLSEGRYIDAKTVISFVLMDTLSVTDSGGRNEVVSNFMTIGVGAKYYLGEPAKSATVPFVLGNAGILFMSSSITRPDPFTNIPVTTDSSNTGFSIQGGGGFAHFVTEEVSLDGTAQVYSYSISGASTSGVRLNVGLTARF